MFDQYVKERQFLKNKREKYHNAITFPIFGALALLDSAEIERAEKGDVPGINVAAAHRVPEAMWSLYGHLSAELTPKQRENIVALLQFLEMRLASFDNGERQTDGWDDAMRSYLRID